LKLWHPFPVCQRQSAGNPNANEQKKWIPLDTNARVLYKIENSIRSANMTDVQKFQEDLRFVRDAVNRRSPGLAGYANIYYMWAAYVLIGYILIDINPVYANWFFLIGGVGAMFVGHFFRARDTRAGGEIDRVRNRQAALHWAGGVGGSILVVVALACVIPALHGPASGQLVVVLIGMVYFLWGVHRDRSFLWLGPVLMVGGVVVGLIPHYRWTSLGAVIAAGLVAAGILARHRQARNAEPQW
jgi:hypothetical protein